MRFPDNFLVGTATSATQIEGGCDNTDWYEFAREPGRIAHGDRPDRACDHWQRFREDVELQARLGLSAHRFSVEWARLEPELGRFDATAIDRYREELHALRAAGIEPMLTLHHFAFPLWLARAGGVLAPEFPARFAEFARKAAHAFGDLVELWITLNEPNVLVAQGYVLGVWPPGQRAPAKVPFAVRQLRRAHRLAYHALHERVPRASVGIAHHLRLATPASHRLPDRAAARLLDAVFNRVFLDLPQDFLGLNYYTRDVVRFSARKPAELFAARSTSAGAELSDLGWEIHPQGLGLLLRDLGRRQKPIYITENGIADATDAKRSRFILDHLRQVGRALSAGIDLRGYFHWSLLDNFEWAEGYAPRFGLHAVDYATQTRTLRPSGALYGEIARTRRCDV